jgi:exodeoxyribonuclease V alpha subunit
LNQLLAELLNPSRPAARLAPGDKVMQIRNNYEKEVFNGDVGFVERYANDSHTLMVRFGEGDVRIVTYGPNEQEELVPAWAISIHKSQGSEYPAVVIPVHTQHFMMLRRNLIYTAITRGKQLVILVGSHKALRMALASHTVAPRYGRLAERFREFAR